MRDFDWMKLIDKRAAVKEQFPRMQQLMNERPGCQADRERRVFYAAENRLSIARAARTPEQRRAREVEDADVFIEEMTRLRREQWLTRLQERRAS